ncbi:MAG TPA: hypothetical protein VK922_16385 [Gemmatimonadaceae bacterium]|nr:hypothetical protein [Gemmatimonadaceae bacterium]
MALVYATLTAAVARLSHDESLMNAIRLPSAPPLAGLLAVVVLAAACGEGRDNSSGLRGGEDSTLAVAAAEAVSATLRGTVLGEDRTRSPLTVEAGRTPWDTIFAHELQRLGSGLGVMPSGGSVLALTTHGFERRGDTAAVTVVLRSCSVGDSTFSFSRDSLIHRLVRSGDAGGAWRLAGPVMHEHAVGMCAPADSAAPAEP